MMMNPPTLPADYVPAVHADELVHALELIRHATAPSPDDGGHHEAAHDLADAALKKVAARRLYEANTECRECAVQPCDDCPDRKG